VSFSRRLTALRISHIEAWNPPRASWTDVETANTGEGDLETRPNGNRSRTSLRSLTGCARVWGYREKQILTSSCTLAVVAADSLAKRDVFRLPDPFAVVTVDGEQTNTTTAIKVRSARAQSHSESRTDAAYITQKTLNPCKSA
jgi:hypothetical protein